MRIAFQSTSVAGSATTTDMKVPLLDLKQQNAPLASELRAAFERVLASGQFILGPEVEELERQTSAIVEVKHAVGVSGTDAILLALMALGIGPGEAARVERQH